MDVYEKLIETIGKHMKIVGECLGMSNLCAPPWGIPSRAFFFLRSWALFITKACFDRLPPLPPTSPNRCLDGWMDWLIWIDLQGVHRLQCSLFFDLGGFGPNENDYSDLPYHN